MSKRKAVTQIGPKEMTKGTMSLKEYKNFQGVMEKFIPKSQENMDKLKNWDKFITQFLEKLKLKLAKYFNPTMTIYIFESSNIFQREKLKEKASVLGDKLTGILEEYDDLLTNYLRKVKFKFSWSDNPTDEDLFKSKVKTLLDPDLKVLETGAMINEKNAKIIKDFQAGGKSSRPLTDEFISEDISEVFKSVLDFRSRNPHKTIENLKFLLKHEEAKSLALKRGIDIEYLIDNFSNFCSQKKFEEDSWPDLIKLWETNQTFFEQLILSRTLDIEHANYFIHEVIIIIWPEQGTLGSPFSCFLTHEEYALKNPELIEFLTSSLSHGYFQKNTHAHTQQLDIALMISNIILPAFRAGLAPSSVAESFDIGSTFFSISTSPEAPSQSIYTSILKEYISKIDSGKLWNLKFQIQPFSLKTGFFHLISIACPSEILPLISSKLDFHQTITEGTDLLATIFLRLSYSKTESTEYKNLSDACFLLYKGLKEANPGLKNLPTPKFNDDLILKWENFLKEADQAIANGSSYSKVVSIEEVQQGESDGMDSYTHPNIEFPEEEAELGNLGDNHTGFFQ